MHVINDNTLEDHELVKKIDHTTQINRLCVDQKYKQHTKVIDKEHNLQSFMEMVPFFISFSSNNIIHTAILTIRLCRDIVQRWEGVKKLSQKGQVRKRVWKAL